MQNVLASMVFFLRCFKNIFVNREAPASVLLPLLPCSCPAHAPTSDLLLPCSCTFPYSCSAPLLPTCSYPTPAEFLLLPCSSLLLPFLALLLVQPCLFPAPAPAHPSLTAFIIISTLQLFSARREPPFMVLYTSVVAVDYSAVSIVSC